MARVYERQSLGGEFYEGSTNTERTAKTRKLYVRSQVQIAEDTESATGHRLVAEEALRLFGAEIIARVDEDGSVPLIKNPDEPAATLRARRIALGLTTAQVARRADVTTAIVEKAETAGNVSPIRELERIAQVLALNEQLLGYEIGAKGDVDLGVRLREFTQLKDTRRFSASDVMALTEAAWVISTQSSMSRLLDVHSSLSDHGFAPDPNYSYPTYERGYQLAALTRKLLDIGPDEPISSIKSLIEEQLYIPVVQQSLAPKFAGATLADGDDRGVVVNEVGQNSNVWVRRMTMAHELGHLLWDPDSRLNKLKVDKYDDVAPLYKERADPVEIRTNAFAISFLAPPNGVRQIVEQVDNLTEAISEVMRTFGIGGTAAKYHVGNVCSRDTSSISMGRLPVASDDWTGRENLTLDWFPLKNTPISRRGRFALLTAKSFKRGLISSDTAAMYLRCTIDELVAQAEAIVGAFN